jgi:hypothetical protein
MLSYHDLKPNPRVLRAFTSLDPEEFERLLIPFEKAWQDYINRHYIHLDCCDLRFLTSA